MSFGIGMNFGLTGDGDIVISGPAKPTRQRLTIPYGDDYTVDVPVVLPSGIDYATCTAFFAMQKCDNAAVGVEKEISLIEVSSILYARVTLTQAESSQPVGRYLYDVEVRTATDSHGTKVSGELDIVRTIVAPVS